MANNSEESTCNMGALGFTVCQVLRYCTHKWSAEVNLQPRSLQIDLAEPATSLGRACFKPLSCPALSPCHAQLHQSRVSLVSSFCFPFFLYKSKDIWIQDLCYRLVLSSHRCRKWGPTWWGGLYDDWWSQRWNSNLWTLSLGPYTGIQNPYTLWDESTRVELRSYCSYSKAQINAPRCQAGWSVRMME